MAHGFRQTFSGSGCSAFFKTDYASSRAFFLAQCQQHGNDHSEQQRWSLNVDGNELCTDTFWFGPTDAKNVLVLISGTHGVEGFCGSAMQSFIVHALAQQWLVLPPNCALLIVHALNPWGMHWARRCDHQGIDINRNFIDFQQLPAADQNYSHVLACLLEDDALQRRPKLHQLAEKLGQRDFEQVYSGGQFEYPWAPFYGGQQASFSSQVIDGIIAKWQLDQRQLTVIDIHTGLGNWSYGELISDHPAGSHGNQFARQLFGNNVAVTALGDSCSVPKLGLLDYRWHPLMKNAGCFLTLEFGTLGTESLFEVLLDEHRFWQQVPNPSVIDNGYQVQRQAMLAHFYPQDPLWQQAVLFRGWQLVQQYFIRATP